MEAGNGIQYRLQRIEGDVKDLRDELRDYGAMKERVTNLSKAVGELGDEVASLRRALIGTGLAVTGSAVVFAFTIFQVI